MTKKTLSFLVSELYTRRKYTDDLITLALGLAEEVGEVAKAINVHSNPRYRAEPNASQDSIEHELIDTMIYLVAIGNALELDVVKLATIKMQEKLDTEWMREVLT